MRKRNHQDEVVETYYCIDPRRLEMVLIYRTRGNVLEKWDDGVCVGNQAILPGRRSETEIVTVWGYSVVMSLTAGAEDTEWGQAKIAEVQAKAADLRKSAAQGPTQGRS